MGQINLLLSHRSRRDLRRGPGRPGLSDFRREGRNLTDRGHTGRPCQLAQGKEHLHSGRGSGGGALQDIIKGHDRGPRDADHPGMVHLCRDQTTTGVLWPLHHV